MSRLGALELIDRLVDPGSYVSWGVPADHESHDAAYTDELRAAAAKAGTDESVVTGEATILGTRCLLIVSEFAFLAGSIGHVAAGRIVSAIHRATAEGLPVVGLPASGGTRMQEGSPAFVLMADIARAIAEHRAAGHAYLSYLRHPTTGGVFATWGALGQVIWAEPDALVGFLGPKVYELVEGKPFPPGIQKSEHLAKVGVIDEAVAIDDLRDRLAALLGMLAVPVHWGLTDLGPSYEPTAPEPGGWAAIEATRSAERPGLAELLASPFIDQIVELHGTQEGERAESVRLLVARIHGKACVVIGQDRAAQESAPLSPAALRTARRGIRLASEWRLPLVSVVDTAGAQLSKGAEDKAMAPEIARTLAAMTTLTVPSVAVLLGQGCGGGALAMLGARRVIAVDDSWLTPLPAEGASAIVFGDTDHAAELADRQQITAHALHRAGFVSQIVTMDEVHLAVADQIAQQLP